MAERPRYQPTLPRSGDRCGIWAHRRLPLGAAHLNLREEILAAVRAQPGITDAQLARRLGKIHQAINSTCRSLEGSGKLERRKGPNGIGNHPGSLSARGATAPAAVAGVVEAERELVQGSEDLIKRQLKAWLEKEGWAVRVAWAKTRGVDIAAARNGARWLIEVKGIGSLQPMRVNYFLGMLGELLQRMDDPAASYSIALPDHPQYRGLWNRLPQLAKTRTGITMLFVKSDGEVEHLRT